MKKIPTLLSIGVVTALLFASTANAANWRMVKDLPNSKFFIDKASVRIEGSGKNEGDKRKVQTLVSYKSLQRNINGLPFLSMSFIDIISCAKRTRTTLSSVQYEGENGTGRIVNTHKMNSLIPMEIGAGTVDEFVMEMFVCDL